MINSIFNALLNTLFVSIPEETIWVSLVFMMLGRFDLLDWRGLKENWKWFAIPVLPVSIVINIFRYIIIIPRQAMSLITLLMLIGLITYSVKKTDFLRKMKFYKILLFVLIGSIVIAFSDMVYMSLFLYVSHISMNDVNNNIVLNISLSLVARLIQIVFVYVIIYLNILKATYKQILSLFNTKNFYITSIITIVLTLAMWIFVEKILFNELVDINLFYKYVIGVTVIIMPTSFMYITIMNNLSNMRKLQNIEKKYSNMLDNLDKKEV